MSKWRAFPWFAKALIQFLDCAVTKEMDILEVGAGSSTPWLAMRARSVLSYEHDARWHGLVRSKLKESDIDNCEIIHDPLYPELGIRENSREFDMIIIDGRGRVKSMETTFRLLKPGGYLMLDDAERTRYREGKKLLDDLGWRRTELKIDGVKKSAIAWRKPQ